MITNVTMNRAALCSSAPAVQTPALYGEPGWHKDAMAGKQLARVEPLIRTVRDQRVILDDDLARIYGVPTKALNQAIRRNQRRFPGDFCFRLTAREAADLRSQIVTSSRAWGGRRTPPLAFTEHGAIMAATVLKSPRAIQMSSFVVRAFLRLREWVVGQAALSAKLRQLEKRVGAHDHHIRSIIEAIRELVESADPPRRRIGFGAGQSE